MPAKSKDGAASDGVVHGGSVDVATMSFVEHLPRCVSENK